MLNNTSVVVVMLFSVMFGMILVPLLGSFVLHLLSKLLKFEKQSWKTALYCSLINVGILIAINSVFAILFIGKIQQIPPVFSLLSFLVSFIAGTYVVRRFYNESVLRSFLVLFFTALVMIVVFIIIAIVASIILGPYLLKGGVLK